MKARPTIFLSGVSHEFGTFRDAVENEIDLLGTYLRDAHAGDIRKRDLVKLEEADAEEQGGHAFHVMDAYVKWLESESDRSVSTLQGVRSGEPAKAGTPNGQRTLALLRLLGLFDRPATADCLDALLKAPAIPGLTEALVGMSEAQRNMALTRLESAKLLTVHRDAAGTLLSLDAHPLLREYFARAVRSPGFSRSGASGPPEGGTPNAAISAGNLSELELTLGDIDNAVADGERILTYTQWSGEWGVHQYYRASYADALHQAGRVPEAVTRFREVEEMQFHHEPECPLLYSVRGFRYCDLLLTEAERAAWQTLIGRSRREEAHTSSPESQRLLTSSPTLMESCRAVEQRAAAIQKQRTGLPTYSLLDIALDHLTLGRAALYRAILEHFDFRLLTSDFSYIDQAVAGLRRAGNMDDLPRALLTRAWLRSLTGTRIGPESAQSDLDEAWEIAEPIQLKSGVKLIGAGQDKTRIVYRGTKPLSLVKIAECQDVEVAHLTLDGQDNPLVRDGMTGGNSRRLFIHHMTFCNLGKDSPSFSHGIIFSGQNPTMERGVTDSTISDCRFERIGLKAKYGGGIRLAWGSGRNRVERNVIRDTGRGGIFGDHSADLVIRHNQVSGSGGEGLGIEIWGGCPRSLIEDNVVDHWISVDQGNQTAVRRNVVGTDDGTLKGYGIEIIASDIVVTDNVVKRGASIGLSVSNKPRKNNVFWGYNTIRDCAQWGVQLQGESGGIAHHYFYRCNFEATIRGDPRARYPRDSGHGFRFNGSSRELVFEECGFRNNGGYGVQFGGPQVDCISFLRCVFTNNSQGVVTGLAPEMTVDFKDCQVAGDKAGQLRSTKAFPGSAPVADFGIPQAVHTGAAAQFECKSKSGMGTIAERLWDFGHGIAEVEANPKHTFEQPGKYRVTLIVWDAAGRGARMEKLIEVMSGQ